MTSIAEAGDQLLTFDELAEYLSVPKQTLYVWRVRGTCPPGFKVGRFVRFRKSAVDAWLQNKNS